MALTEVSFYNTNGDEINISNIVSQMVNYYDLKLSVGETRVTDFQEGSEIRNLLEAFAVAVYALLEEQHEATRIAFIQSSYGLWLDRIGELPFINLPRVEGAYATGEVTFTLADAQSSEYTVPADTIVACSDSGLEFVTTTDCIISVGETSGVAAVECLTTGVDGNVLSGSVDTVVGGSELVSVTNSDGFNGGADLEDDEEYRERLLENVQADGFGTQGYYLSLCESIEGVHDVLLVDATGYTKKVLVNGDTKPTSNAVLLDVLTVLSDNDNHVLGHTFTVDKPSYSSGHTLAVTLSVSAEVSDDDLEAVLSALFDGGSVFQLDFDGCNINDTLSKQDIVDALLVFDEVLEVTSITESGNEITTLTPGSNDVLSLTSVSFTQNEVE